ncbi:MAG TPA: hypothetical protein V6D12_18490 [Candidatus Obscuribacterales bacterium]
MKQVISFVQTIRLRQIIASFILGIALLLTSAVSYAQAQPFTAEPMTPEASSYQVDKSGDNQDAGKNVFENIKEKLNLDEPLPRSTKDFFNEVQGKSDGSESDLAESTQKGLKDAAQRGTSR